MKKFLIMAAMVLSSVGAFAQYSAGDITIQPKIGLNCATLSGDGTDYKAGFVGGVEAEYHVSPLIGISGGVLYSMQGSKIKDSDVKYNLDYVNIPILANFYVAKGLALKVGVQPAFNTNAKISKNGNSIKLKDSGMDVNSFDFSIPVGISYEYANICLDARYNIGAIKAIKDGVIVEDGVKVAYEGARNNVFQLTLGYKFKL